MTNNSQLMYEAIGEAQKCTVDVPVGCLIVNRAGLVIARGHNQREELNDPSAHAEIVALRAAAASTGSWRLAGATLICTLEPCPMCAEAIIQSRVERVIFGAWDSVAGACGSVFNLFTGRQALPTPEVIGGILEEETRQLLVEFFRKRRKE